MPNEHDNGSDHLSPINKRINLLIEMAGMYDLIAEEIAVEQHRKDLLKECVAAYLERERAAEKKQLERNNDTFNKPASQTTQHQETAEIKLITDLTLIFKDFAESMAKAASVATAAAMQTANQVLAQYGYQPHSPTGQAVHALAQNAYHLPTLMHAASHVMQHTQAASGAHAFTVASEEHTVAGTHESLHHHIKQERAALARVMAEPAKHHTEKFEHDLLDRWARLSAAITHGKSLALAHHAHPTADHVVLREVTGRVLTSDAHADFVQTHRDKTKETFQKFKAAAANAGQHYTNPADALREFFKIYPPVPRPAHTEEKDGTHKHTASSPFKLRPRTPGES